MRALLPSFRADRSHWSLRSVPLPSGRLCIPRDGVPRRGRACAAPWCASVGTRPPGLLASAVPSAWAGRWAVRRLRDAGAAASGTSPRLWRGVLCPHSGVLARSAPLREPLSAVTWVSGRPRCRLRGPCGLCGNPARRRSGREESPQTGFQRGGLALREPRPLRRAACWGPSDLLGLRVPQRRSARAVGGWEPWLWLKHRWSSRHRLPHFLGDAAALGGVHVPFSHTWALVCGTRLSVSGNPRPGVCRVWCQRRATDALPRSPVGGAGSLPASKARSGWDTVHSRCLPWMLYSVQPGLVSAF